MIDDGFSDQLIEARYEEAYLALDALEATLDAMSRDETTTLDDMVEAVRAMKRQYQEGV